jgi:TPR repeat protein
LSYIEGEGVPKDYEKAVYWSKKAADQGNSIARRNLGWLLWMRENGEI